MLFSSSVFCVGKKKHLIDSYQFPNSENIREHLSLVTISFPNIIFFNFSL